MKKYLIIYDDALYVEFEASSLYACIVDFAKYTGCCSALFEKAISGIDYNAAGDFVDMYNHFSCYKIRKIYLVDKEIYKEED